VGETTESEGRMSVTLKITTCKLCPHRKVERAFHNGSETWTCRQFDKVIAVDIEWSSEEPKVIPKWCPLRKKNQSGNGPGKEE
jgi:hypothetical protein